MLFLAIPGIVSAHGFKEMVKHYWGTLLLLVVITVILTLTAVKLCRHFCTERTQGVSYSGVLNRNNAEVLLTPTHYYQPISAPIQNFNPNVTTGGYGYSLPYGVYAGQPLRNPSENVNFSQRPLDSNIRNPNANLPPPANYPVLEQYSNRG